MLRMDAAQIVAGRPCSVQIRVPHVKLVLSRGARCTHIHESLENQFTHFVLFSQMLLKPAAGIEMIRASRTLLEYLVRLQAFLNWLVGVLYSTQHGFRVIFPIWAR